MSDKLKLEIGWKTARLLCQCMADWERRYGYKLSSAELSAIKHFMRPIRAFADRPLPKKIVYKIVKVEERVSENVEGSVNGTEEQ